VIAVSSCVCACAIPKSAPSCFAYKFARLSRAVSIFPDSTQHRRDQGEYTSIQTVLCITDRPAVSKPCYFSTPPFTFHCLPFVTLYWSRTPVYAERRLSCAAPSARLGRPSLLLCISFVPNPQLCVKCFLSSALRTPHFAHSSSELYSPTLLLLQNGMLIHTYKMDLKVAFLTHAWASLTVTALRSARFGNEAYDDKGLLRKEGPLSSLYEFIVCIRKCCL
jgi:hypothetical protein